jgi:hypothetical protein
MTTPKLYRYYLPSALGEGWAEVALCSSGMFASVSDYGNYAYAWRSTGEKDFRAWIANLAEDPAYVMGKLNGGRKQVFNGAATCIKIKRHIIEQRRRGSYTKDEARDEWDLLGEHEDLYSEYNFSRWYDDTKIGDAAEFAVYEYPGDLRAFCEKVMPRLATVIRAELAAEKEAA